MTKIYTRVVWRWEDGVLVQREADWYEYFGPLALAKAVFTPVQSSFRFRSDGGAVDATPTWIAGEKTNVAIDCSGGNVTFRLRVAVQETGGVADTGATYQIRSSLDNYAAVITTTSTNGIQAANASTDADNTAINTSRLTGLNAYVAGSYDETGTTGSVTLTANNYTEFEFGLTAVAATLTDGQIIDFHVFWGTTALTVYSVTPRITIRKATTFGTHKNSVGLGVAATAVTATNTTNEKAVLVAGDLVVAVAQNRTAIATGMSDSLGNSWTAFNAGASNGTNVNLRGWYSVVTNAGEASFTVTWTAAASFARLAVDVFDGPYASPSIDANPALSAVTGTTCPTTTNFPATGALAQADELVVCYTANAATRTITPTAPLVLYQQVNPGGDDPTAILAEVVASTTSVVPAACWSTGPVTVLGTASFKKAATAFTGPFMQLPQGESIVYQKPYIAY